MLSALAGLLLGVAVWWYVSPLYNRPLVAAARPLTALLHGGAMQLEAHDRDLMVTRSDAPERIRRVRIPIADLTINLILLTTLFAINSQPLRRRNLGHFALAALVLAAFHVPAIVAKTEAFYALQPGEWSREAYGGFGADVWVGIAHFYQLVGMYAIAVVAWWLLRPRAEETPKERKTRASKASSRKRGR